jgi:hypothetical protein
LASLVLAPQTFQTIALSNDKARRTDKLGYAMSDKATSVKRRISISGSKEKCSVKKSFLRGFIAALTFSFLAASNCACFEVVHGATSVGGVLSDNTTWTLANSPYILTSTVQVPSNVTLTIEAGTTIISNVGTSTTTGDMFSIIGTIIAHGTIDKKIIFDGSNSSNFFHAHQSDLKTFLDLDYCIIRNGRSLWWWGPGHFSLTHSEISNLIDLSYVWYPRKNVTIEYNKFTDSAGFSIALGAVNGSVNGNVSIRNNLFQRNIGYVVKNVVSYPPTQTIVKYNSFSEMWGTVLELEHDSPFAAMDASDNYWGTTNTSIIDAVIHDKNDDITLAGVINYLPILQTPDPNTPTLDKSPVPEFPTSLIILPIILPIVIAAVLLGARHQNQKKKRT